MFKDIYIAPVLFLESILGCFMLPKIASINPAYGTSMSGGLLTGFAVSGIIPQIHSFYGYVSALCAMFVLYCVQTAIDSQNVRKTVSLWSNCLGMSSYGLVSGVSLSLVTGHKLIHFAASLIISTLAISYSLGNRYIEYVSRFKDKVPLLAYCASTPIGMIAGKYSGIDTASSNVLFGVSAGTFLMFGITNLVSHSKHSALSYLDESVRSHNDSIICMCAFVGLAVAAFLQSPLFIDMMVLV